MTLNDFAEDYKLGLPRINYFPDNKPSKRWRLFLHCLILPENPSGPPYGWGERLEDAYGAYIANIKGRLVRLHHSHCGTSFHGEYFVPKILTLF